MRPYSAGDYGIQLLSSVLYSTVSLKEIRERDAGQIVCLKHGIKKFKVPILRGGVAILCRIPINCSVTHTQFSPTLQLYTHRAA